MNNRLVMAFAVLCLAETELAYPHEIRWKVPLNGDGGGVVVHKGRVLIGNRSQDGETVHMDCYDSATGKLYWRTSHNRLPVDELDNSESALRSVPAVSDDSVLYYTTSGHLVCVDLQGLTNGDQGQKVQPSNGEDILWDIDLRKQYGVFLRDDLEHGCPGISPTIVDNVVYSATGNGSTHGLFSRYYKRRNPSPDAPSVVAFDLKDGHKLWGNAKASPNILHSSRSTPVLVNNLLINVAGDGCLQGLDPVSGESFWKDNSQWFWTWKSPVITKDLFIIATDSPPGILETTSVSVIAYRTADISSAKKPTPEWVFRHPNYEGSWTDPIVLDDTVFVLSKFGELIAIDAANGTEIWRDELELIRWECFPAMVRVGSSLLVPYERGFRIYSSGKKREVRTYSLDSSICNTPAILDRTMFVNLNGSSLAAIALDLKEVKAIDDAPPKNE